MNFLKYAFWYSRGVFWRVLRRAGFVAATDTMADQKRDHIAPFDSYYCCDVCGCSEYTEVLQTSDGMHIVECSECGLWFTNPRIDEEVWKRYLFEDSPRSMEFTENRLKYGAALSANIKYTLPNWRDGIDRVNGGILDSMSRVLGTEVRRVHDVGCGIGCFLDLAKRRGLDASGNELNGYACKVMNERLGYKVYNCLLEDVPLQPETLDAVLMQDYIEHTYHPFRDFQSAHRLLRPGGVLYVSTFHLGCALFDKQGGEWNYLYWNHMTHFSRETLLATMERAGFQAVEVHASYNSPGICVCARKL